MLKQSPRNHLIQFALIFLLLGQGLFAHDQRNAQIDPKSGTVVCVHGFMSSPKRLRGLVSSFKKDGWQTENWSYPSKQKNIEEHAQDLVLRLNQIAIQRPDQPINFVAHSMGGLIVRCALNHLECPQEAKMGRAVLIGPPNKGSIYARELYKCRPLRKVLGEKSGTQLMRTPFNGFDKLGDFPDQMHILIISGTAGINPMIRGINDGKVGLQETCLKTPHFHEKSFAGHSWLCSTPTVIKKAKRFFCMNQTALKEHVIAHQIEHKALGEHKVVCAAVPKSNSRLGKRR